MFLWNILLAFIWAAVTRSFNLSSVVVGLIFGYLVLFVAQPVMGPSTYFSRIGNGLSLALFYLWELVKANLRVAADVVKSTRHLRPGVVAIHLEAKTEAEVTMLSNLIALTPGSLSLDVSSDRRFLYVHGMKVDDQEKFRQSIKDLERRILKVLR